jgi:hypothetical protein
LVNVKRRASCRSFWLLEVESRWRPFSRIGMGTTRSGGMSDDEFVFVAGRRRSFLYVVRRRGRLLVDRARSKSFKRMVFVADEPEAELEAVVGTAVAVRIGVTVLLPPEVGTLLRSKNEENAEEDEADVVR